MVELPSEIVAGSFDNAIYRIDKSTFQIITSFSADFLGTTKIAYSSDYNLLMVTGYYSNIYVYDVADNFNLLRTLSYHE